MRVRRGNGAVFYPCPTQTQQNLLSPPLFALCFALLLTPWYYTLHWFHSLCLIPKWECREDEKWGCRSRAVCIFVSVWWCRLEHKQYNIEPLINTAPSMWVVLIGFRLQFPVSSLSYTSAFYCVLSLVTQLFGLFFFIFLLSFCPSVAKLKYEPTDRIIGSKWLQLNISLPFLYYPSMLTLYYDLAAKRLKEKLAWEKHNFMSTKKICLFSKLHCQQDQQ